MILPLRKALEIYNRQNPPVAEAAFAALCEAARLGPEMVPILGVDETRRGGEPPKDPMDRTH